LTQEKRALYVILSAQEASLPHPPYLILQIFVLHLSFRRLDSPASQNCGMVPQTRDRYVMEKTFSQGRRKLMRLREHPKIQWPPTWSESGEMSLKGDDGILRDVVLIEPSKLLLSNELDGKVYFAEIYCFNNAFAARLHEKIKPCVGRPMNEVGGLDF
jgi:hypothetical protein